MKKARRIALLALIVALAACCEICRRQHVRPSQTGNDVGPSIAQVQKDLRARYLSEYGLLWAYLGEIPDAQDCSRGFPNAVGYHTPIDNQAMYTGTYLEACIREAESDHDTQTIELCRRMMRGLLRLASVSPEPGMVVRGVGKDGQCHYSTTTTCQVTPWLIGLFRYHQCTFATPEEKAVIRETIRRVIAAWEANDWFLPSDGVLQGQRWGDVNGTCMPYRESTHFLCILRICCVLFEEAKWNDLYQRALSERCDRGVTRVEGCAGGIAADCDFVDVREELGIYVCTQEALSLLCEYEGDDVIRAQFRQGLVANADLCHGYMKYAREYDNRKETPYKFANWREGRAQAWRPQRTIEEALAVSRAPYSKELLGRRAYYEQLYVTAPLAAAAICAYAGKYQSEIVKTLTSYDYEQINIVEKFMAEVAYSCLLPACDFSRKE